MERKPAHNPFHGMVVLTVKDVAHALRISTATVWDKVRNEEGFPQPFKWGSQTRWKPEKIIEYGHRIAASENTLAG